MAEDTRPEWTFDIPEKLMRWIRDHNIPTLKSGWRMVGVDRSEEWIELIANDGSTREVKDQRFYRKPCVWDYIKLNESGGHSIVKYTSQGESARDLLDKIDLFEKNHAAERAQYERLRKKFGNA